MKNSTQNNITTQPEANKTGEMHPKQRKPKPLDVLEIKPPTGLGDDRDPELTYKQTTSFSIRMCGCELGYKTQKEINFRNDTTLYLALFVLFTLLPLGMGSYLQLL